MPEETIVAEVKTEPVAQPVAEAPVTPKEDLLTRVSKVNLTPKPKEPDNPFGLSKEDYDKVNTDPTLSKFYKSMQADYTRSKQQIAAEKKDLEAKLNQDKSWTPERIATLLNDPNFVQAAQQVLTNPPNSGYNNTEWSMLSDNEKKQIVGMQQQIQSLQLQNTLAGIKQQDEQLKTKYANYDPQAVDIITNDLLQGKVQATREHLYKVLDYDNAVNRAYELGKQDARVDTTEKVNSSSVDGYVMKGEREVPAANKGESGGSFFRRLAENNLRNMIKK